MIGLRFRSAEPDTRARRWLALRRDRSTALGQDWIGFNSVFVSVRIGAAACR
jgi:hypothetical protein